MTVVSISQASKWLYTYKEDFLKNSRNDEDFVGKANFHIVGRVLNFAVCAISHAEAICRAVYVCFLTLKEIFFKTDRQLIFEEIKICQGAMETSFSHFILCFTLEPSESLEVPATPHLIRQTADQGKEIEQPTEGTQGKKEKEEEEGIYTPLSLNQIFRQSLLIPSKREFRGIMNPPPGFSYNRAPASIKFDSRFITSGDESYSTRIDVCHYLPHGQQELLAGLRSEHLFDLLEGGNTAPANLALDLVFSAVKSSDFKIPVSCLIITLPHPGGSDGSFEKIDSVSSVASVDSPVPVYQPKSSVNDFSWDNLSLAEFESVTPIGSMRAHSAVSSESWNLLFPEEKKDD